MGRKAHESHGRKPETMIETADIREPEAERQFAGAHG